MKPKLAIPNSVRITPKVTYGVLWFAFENGNRGETIFDPKEMRINLNITDSKKESTFMHEVIHAISHEHEIGLTESQVLKLEKGLMRLIRLNPKLFK
jgi:Zn-dependent peptidase ImmA (M78 family)